MGMFAPVYRTRAVQPAFDRLAQRERKRDSTYVYIRVNIVTPCVLRMHALLRKSADQGEQLASVQWAVYEIT